MAERAGAQIEGEVAMVAFGSRLGGCLSQALPAAPEQGLIVYLSGDLGAGKTTVCRGVLQAFGHRGAVKSPTYTLVEPYVFGATSVYHFDLYRLGDAEELEFLGVRDYFEAGNLCLIEWPNRGEGFLPAADLTVKVEVSAPGRRVLLEAGSARGRDIVRQLEQKVGNAY